MDSEKEQKYLNLDKMQKFLLLLIVFFSIIFIYELSVASAEPETVEIASDAQTFSESQNVQKQEEEQSKENEVIDYSQPLSLPEEYYEQKEQEADSKQTESDPSNEETNNSSDESENSTESNDLINESENESENESTIDINETNSSQEDEYEEPEPEPFHDLGISRLEAEPDSENPLRIKITLQVKNYGDFEETGLHLRRTIGNETTDYGPYDDTIVISRTRYYQKTFSEKQEVNITFEILNYSNFELDTNQTNNIKTITVNL